MTPARMGYSTDSNAARARIVMGDGGDVTSRPRLQRILVVEGLGCLDGVDGGDIPFNRYYYYYLV